MTYEKKETAPTGSSGGGGAIRNAGRVNTGGSSGTGGRESAQPQSFPFRRLRLKPKPGIRAEAAGELLWPVYGTPYQNLYND